MPRPEALEVTLRQIGAYEIGHTILNSGLHTMERVTVDMLADHPRLLAPYFDDIEEIATGMGVDLFVPVPRGALRVMDARVGLWGINVIRPQKVGQRDFRIPRKQDYKPIQEARRIGVFEDAVTTGGTSAAMADLLRGINPEADFALIGMVRRGRVLPEHAARFAAQAYLLEKEIETWTAEACPVDHDALESNTVVA